MKILRQREIASLENFTVKKKKKKIDFAPLEIEASSNEFSSLVSERIRSRGRAVERQSRLSFREPSSFYATFPTPLPSLPSNVARSPTRTTEAPFLRRVVRGPGGRMSEETETHWHRFHTLPFFYIWNIIKRGKRGGNRLRSSSERRALVTNGRWTGNATRILCFLNNSKQSSIEFF